MTKCVAQQLIRVLLHFLANRPQGPDKTNMSYFPEHSSQYVSYNDTRFRGLFSNGSVLLGYTDVRGTELQSRQTPLKRETANEAGC